jgi:tRNA1Val (adenine37-N6)-methyltransferase
LPAAAFDLDHAMANPPWHDDAGSLPAGALRQRAKMASPGLAAAWIAAMATALRVGGTLTLILPPRGVPESIAALAAAGCGSALLFPLWPKPCREARIVLLQAIKGGRSEFRLLPGLVLHDDAGYEGGGGDPPWRVGARTAMRLNSRARRRYRRQADGRGRWS